MFRRLLKKGILILFLGTDLVAPVWFLKTTLRLFFSRKIKVGFGPIASGEETFAERKWRIDPIIDGINKKRGRYVAGFFLKSEEMNKFDILIIVKKINPTFMGEVERFKNIRFIYDIVDNPNDEPKYRFYFRSFPHFMNKMDAFILSSPTHAPWMKKMGKKAFLIEHPILNTVYKRSYRSGSEIRLLTQGYFENLQNLKWLEELLPELSRRVGKPVRLYYHSEIVRPDSEFVRYIRWTRQNCFEVMVWADIAIAVKDLFKLHQYTKPSTKVIAYMAAGLPVICKPTASDRRVVRDRIDGYFAYREEDWIRWIMLLATHESLRSQVGRAARNAVLQKYRVNHILEKYLHVLDSLSHESNSSALPLSPHS